MAKEPRKLQTDLVVVGAGLAGLAAAAFASRHGLRTVLVGTTSSGVLLASGLLDLLGIYPVEGQGQLDDPWAGIAALIDERPDHPYGRLGVDTIRAAWSEFLQFLESAGLRYVGWPRRNAVLATSLGTLKITYRVPETMWSGVIALQEKPPTLILDFEGMKDFSARQMGETLRGQWPGLRARRLKFPCHLAGVDRYNVTLAEAMESAEVRTALGAAIRPLLDGAELVGMPAMFGTRQPEVVAADLHRHLGVPVFEIPTLPPSVPGLRLKEAMEQELARRGTTLFLGRRVAAISERGPRCFELVVEGEMSQRTLEARGVVLASGRFLGGGLIAGRDGIREPLLSLPVHQPPTRGEWHRRQFFDHRGHPLSQAGLVVDEYMRPLNSDQCVAYDNLFAAGSVLAHQDWMRMKCGAGLAVATAYGAVRSFAAWS